MLSRRICVLNFNWVNKGLVTKVFGVIYLLLLRFHRSVGVCIGVFWLYN